MYARVGDRRPDLGLHRLRAKDADDQKALVRSRDGSWVEKTTKTTSSTRTISLPEHILGKLEAARARASGDRVVPLSGASIYGRLKTILRRNGL